MKRHPISLCTGKQTEKKTRLFSKLSLPLLTILFSALCASVGFAAATDDEKKPKWDVEKSPGETFEQPIDVTQGTWLNLDVSPDGKTVVFDLLGDLYSMPISGADGTGDVFPTKLTSGISWDMQPRFSPDGEWISFTSDRTGKSERGGDNIWIMRSDGSDVRQVTNETFRLINNASWSPDGNYLVARKHFTGRRSLGSGEIWMYHRAAIDANSTEGVQLTKKPNDQKDVNEPILSRDGKYLFYSQDSTPGDSFSYDKDSTQQIYVVKRLELATGKIEDFITGPGGACRPTPSPDGKTIAFVRRVGSHTGLHLLDIESGRIQLLYYALERDMQEAWAIHGVYPSFAWTPDGEHIVAWAKGQIRKISVADGTATEIPFRIRDTRTMSRVVRFPIEVAPEQFPVKLLRWVRVSPRGDQVAFQALGYIYIQALPNGKPQRLTSQTDHFEYCPSYSADGRYLTYVTWNDDSLGSIRVIESTPKAQPELWTVTHQPGHYIDPVFSPNGQTIVYSKSGGGLLTSPLWSRDPGLYQIPARGGEARRISESGHSAQFAASNDKIYFVDSSSSNDTDNFGLYSIDLDGQNRQHHFRTQWGTDFRVSSDAKWIAFIERFNVYVAPFVQTGQPIEVGPKSTALPLVKASQEAGNWVHFSGDSRQLHWSLGPDLFSLPLDAAFAALTENSAAKDSKPVEPTKISLQMSAEYFRPKTSVAITEATIVTMGPEGTIENGTIVIEGNRIAAIGPGKDVKIPAGCQVIPARGLVVTPGFIDVHAHGARGSLGIIPQKNWVSHSELAFGVTTIHDPSNDSNTIFAASEMIKAGEILGPRIFSTGTILYGAAGNFKAEIESLDDARFHLRRMKALGAFSVKSYNQPRRDQRQQVIAAARELEMMVVPEGGSTFMHNLTMIVDGHTGIEHTLPVQTAYEDVMNLWRGTQVGYTPTLCVAYGGLSGERYWYEVDDLFLHPRLTRFVPQHVLSPPSRRRQKAPLEDYNHIKVAEIARQVVRDGGLVQAGGHGQLAGLATHWEMWGFVQGGMTPMEALQCGTINGAKYLGLDKDLGSLEVGKLADLVIYDRGRNPVKEIRDSEFISMVVANGRVFDAATMEELAGAKLPAPKFYFNDGTQQLGVPIPRIPGCDCLRPGQQLPWMIER
jgi:Tol biopolymer transport system component/imidazolonepropionase-like amidohydrolase